MILERRAEVVAYLRDILNGCEGGWSRVRTEPSMWPGAIRDALEALDVGCADGHHEDFKGFCVRCGLPAAKPSESSMVQRIEALEATDESKTLRIEGLTGGVQHILNLARAALTKGGLEEALENIEITARDVLDGPPDPERDRETRAEVERP